MESSPKLLKPPNMLRCLACKHSEEWDGRPWTEKRPGRKSWTCSECGGTMTVRCGMPLKKRPDGDSRPCLKIVTPGRRCGTKNHGGIPRAKGPAASNWINGDSSRFVPNNTPRPVNGNGSKRYVHGDWRESYEHLRFDHEGQREVRHELALLGAMLDDLNRRRETAESRASWAALAKLGAKMEAQLETIRDEGGRQKVAAAAGQVTAEAEAAKKRQAAGGELMSLSAQMLPLIHRGVGKGAIEREILDVVANRTKTFLADVKAREQLSRENLTAAGAQLIDVFGEVVESVLETELGADAGRALAAKMMGELLPRTIAAAQFPGGPRVTRYLTDYKEVLVE